MTSQTDSDSEINSILSRDCYDSFSPLIFKLKQQQQSPTKLGTELSWLLDNKIKNLLYCDNDKLEEKFDELKTTCKEELDELAYYCAADSQQIKKRKKEIKIYAYKSLRDTLLTHLINYKKTIYSIRHNKQIIYLIEYYPDLLPIYLTTNKITLPTNPNDVKYWLSKLYNHHIREIKDYFTKLNTISVKNYTEDEIIGLTYKIITVKLRFIIEYIFKSSLFLRLKFIMKFFLSNIYFC